MEKLRTIAETHELLVNTNRNGVEFLCGFENERDAESVRTQELLAGNVLFLRYIDGNPVLTYCSSEKFSQESNGRAVSNECSEFIANVNSLLDEYNGRLKKLGVTTRITVSIDLEKQLR